MDHDLFWIKTLLVSLMVLAAVTLYDVRRIIAAIHACAGMDEDKDRDLWND